jgi:hypothetical protein
MYRKLLWFAIILLLIGCTTTETATRKAPKVWSTYSGNVLSTCWDMTMTVYLLEKARLPNAIEIEMLFESAPTTGFHYGKMIYNNRYYDVLAKIEDINGSTCDRPLHFLCSVDRYPNPSLVSMNP